MKTIIKTVLIALLILNASCSKDDPIPPSKLAISSISPSTGAKGTTVFITGVDFSPNASSNIVTLNGKSCIVNSASATTLNITIPPNAGSGTIDITVAGTTVHSNTFAFIYTTTVTTLAGSTQGFADGSSTTAQFLNPSSVAVDATGNVYVADMYNHKIRKISPQGNVSTLAGSTQGFADGSATTAQFNFPTSIAIDASGNVFVGDWLNFKIRKITPQGNVSTLAGSGVEGFADGIATTAKFDRINGLAVDASGNVYVADYNNHKIRKISPQGNVSTLAGSTQGFADGSATTAQFYFPTGITVDASGNLFVTEFNDKIRKITPVGEVSTLAGSQRGFADGLGVNAQFNMPFAVTIDATGNVFVADTYNHKIRKITPVGEVSTIAGGSPFGFADGIGTMAKFYNPTGIAVDATGILYVADKENHKIRKIVID